jgi:hypothetical protein
MVKKRGKKSSSVSKSRGIKLSDYKRKTSLILRNLTIFVILFVSTLGLSYVSSGEFLPNLFWIAALITGFVSVALVISYFIFLFFKLFGK